MKIPLGYVANGLGLFVYVQNVHYIFKENVSRHYMPLFAAILCLADLHLGIAVRYWSPNTDFCRKFIIYIIAHKLTQTHMHEDACLVYKVSISIKTVAFVDLICL